MSKYTIGEISKLLNLSSETLRHYERQGMISPKRDEKSGYRYYDTWDMTFLMNIIYYRSFNFSLSEIDEIVKKRDLADLESMCEERLTALEGEIAELKRKAAGLLQYQGTLLKTLSDLNKLEICKSPSIMFQRHRKKRRL